MFRNERGDQAVGQMATVRFSIRGDQEGKGGRKGGFSQVAAADVPG